MTKKTQLVVAKRLHEGGQRFSVGTTLDEIQVALGEGNVLTEDRIAHLTQTKFLRPADELERERNPEAYVAKQQASEAEDVIADLRRQLAEAQQGGADSAEANRLAGDLAGIKALFPDTTDTAAVIEQIKGLQESQSSADDLQKQYDDLLAQFDEAQANAAKPEDVAALAEYREVVGELLPHDYPERKLLLSLGYLTTAQVAATKDADLEAEKGLGKVKVEAIRKVTPYAAPKG